MLLNDMKEELRRFATRYCLDFKFRENRDMRCDSTGRLSVCTNITYIFTFINPRTGYTRKFEINHTDVMNIGDELVRAIKDNVLRDDGLVDLLAVRMKKPEWMTDVENFYPKQMYISTASTLDQSGLVKRLKDELCGGYEPEFLLKKFNIPDNSEWVEKFNTGILTDNTFVKFLGEGIMKPKIEKVIFNRPATIIFWSDGTKTVVQAQDEAFDEEKGLAMAIAKKFLGNQGNYFDEFKKWLPEKNSKSVVKEVYLTVKEFAEKTGQSVSTVRKDCARGLHPGAKKVDGKWMIPYEGMVKGGK